MMVGLSPQRPKVKMFHHRDTETKTESGRNALTQTLSLLQSDTGIGALRRLPHSGNARLHEETNERTNERTNKRTNKRTNEGTNEGTKT
jgi:hypothetical protein